MQGIAERPENPGGVMFHFSGAFEDEFFSVTAYRDGQSSAQMFADYTGPEVESAIRTSGERADINRLEFPITRYAVRDDEDLQGYSRKEPGEMVAVYATAATFSRERYLKITGEAGFPDDWPEGLVIHVAGEFGNRWGIFDVWHADSDLLSFYRDRIEAAVATVAKDIEGGVMDQPKSIALHSLYVNRGTFEDIREYLREE
ncbi:MAG: hypothetical protein ACRDKI_07195 [Solirubrobacterales bacterium]